MTNRIYRSWVRSVFAAAESTDEDVKQSWQARADYYLSLLDIDAETT